MLMGVFCTVEAWRSAVTTISSMPFLGVASWAKAAPATHSEAAAAKTFRIRIVEKPPRACSHATAAPRVAVVHTSLLNDILG
jgi:hypothetical protein